MEGPKAPDPVACEAYADLEKLAGFAADLSRPVASDRLEAL